MPTYTYRDTRKGITKSKRKPFDLEMSIDEMVTFEKKNPHLQRVYQIAPILDPINIGVQRPPADFQKYVLGKVKDRNPLGSVEKRWAIKKEI